MDRLFSVLLLLAVLLCPADRIREDSVQPVFFSMLFPQLIPQWMLDETMDKAIDREMDEKAVLL